MDLLKDYIEQFLTEMPIGKLEKLGNFNKSGAFKSQDLKLLNNPKAIEKIHKQWEKTPYQFDMYLLNIPQLNKSEFRERGEINYDNLQIIQSYAKKITGQELQFNSNAITILFNGNYGAEKIPMTGWTLAHRFGHASARDNYDWKEYINRVREIFSELASDVYKTYIDSDLVKRNFVSFREDYVDLQKYNKILRLLYQQLGTMKSAREGKLRNEYEFYYELLAQYLLTGSIKFKPVPLELIVGHLPYGRKDKRRAVDPQVAEMWSRDLEAYASEIGSYIDNFISSCVGNVYLM